MGTGITGNGNLAVINGGVIDATPEGGTTVLTLNGSGGVKNTKLLEATVGGSLLIQTNVTNMPDKVNVHDFVDKELGKVAPYGVYDVTANTGCVSVGISNDTAEFAVNSIRRWLVVMGCTRYTGMNQLTITADGGGSNGSRVRLFKIELQKLADETGLTLQVCHYPPGTSKWNKIEHRLFCHITQNWRGKPLTSRETVVELIASTTTRTGLTGPMRA